MGSTNMGVDFNTIQTTWMGYLPFMPTGQELPPHRDHHDQQSVTAHSYNPLVHVLAWIFGGALDVVCNRSLMSCFI